MAAHSTAAPIGEMTDERLRMLLLYWGRRGGTARYAFEMARALASLPSVQLGVSVSEQSEWLRDFVSLGAPTIPVRTFSGLPSALLATPGAAVGVRRLARRMRAMETEVVFAAATHVWDLLALRASRVAGAPYVLVVHDAHLHPGEENQLVARLLREEIRRADIVIALTEHVRAQVVEIVGATDTCFVVPHPAFPPRFGGRARERSRTGNAPLRLLHVGRQLHYKGPDLFIESVATLSDAGFEIDATIAGDGPALDPLLMKRAESAGVHVRQGWLSEPDLERIVGDSDLVVIPYREASQSGVVALAAGLGVPSVVTPVGGLPEQVMPYSMGRVAAAASAEAIATEIAAIASDLDLLPRLSRSCLRAAAGPLSWPHIAARLVEAIRDPIAPRTELGQ